MTGNEIHQSRQSLNGQRHGGKQIGAIEHRKGRQAKLDINSPLD